MTGAGESVWADVWRRALARRGARAGLAWLGVAGLAGLAGPLIASGHPLLLRAGAPARWTSPLLRHLTAPDWFALAWGACACVVLLVPARAGRLRRVAWLGGIGIVGALLASLGPGRGLETFPWRDGAGTDGARVVWTLVPWSPGQRASDRDTSYLPPLAPERDAMLRRVLRDAHGQRVTLQRAVDEIDALPLDEGSRAGAIERLADAPGASASSVPVESVRETIERALSRFGARHALGTDARGQDVLSVMIHGARISLGVGIVATLLATLIGVVVGAAMGYAGGLIDALGMRLIEIVSGVPMLFVLVVAASVLPRSPLVLVGAIGLLTWTGAARYTRGEVLRVRSMAFVESARATGAGTWATLVRHVLPAAAAPVIVDTSFTMAGVVLLEATLSFLGLGPAGGASWGRLLADALTDTGEIAWWLGVFPGAAIFLTTWSLIVLGDCLRDALDPAGATPLGTHAGTFSGDRS